MLPGVERALEQAKVKCSCTLPVLPDGTPDVPTGTWFDEASSYYHPGTLWDVRILLGSGPVGIQCTYVPDESRTRLLLVTHGYGVGTLDMVSPGHGPEALLGHWLFDVVPYKRGRQLDGGGYAFYTAAYIKHIRPALGTRGCPRVVAP